MSSGASHTIDQMPRGQRRRVLDLIGNAEFGALDALVTRRLKELGFLPGAWVEVIGHGFFGRDPVSVRLGGSKFALRRAEARKVRVEASGP
ncbi:MAG: ferrous iron transport protein A [Lysobacterales bacterium]